MIETRLRGHTAIITGAQHGVGAATAIALAREGVRVVVTYKRIWLNEPPPFAITEEYLAAWRRDAGVVVSVIEAEGGEVAAIEADLASEDAPATLFAFAEERFGPADILVNNAAHWHADSLRSDARVIESGPQTTTVTRETFDAHMAVNARATALLMREFASRHSLYGLDWGRVVSVSTEGARCFPGEISYGASKAAMESLTRSAAVELGRSA
jgi:3-oxoacyl-[acyl-carrier protein] reductase